MVDPVGVGIYAFAGGASNGPIRGDIQFTRHSFRGLQAGHSAHRLGAGRRQPPDGCLVRNGADAAALLSRQRAWRLRHARRLCRGAFRCGGDGDEAFLRRARRLDRTAQAVGRPWIRARRAFQIRFSACHIRRRRGGCEGSRPGRQGHSRHAARRTDCRRDAAGPARRQFRIAQIARYGRRLRRAASRHCPHARLQRRCARRLLGGGRAGGTGRASPRLRRPGAGKAAGPRRRAGAAACRFRQAQPGGLDRHRRRLPPDARAFQRSLPAAEGRGIPALPPPSCPSPW